jgi:hypothetical protein
VSTGRGINVKSFILAEVVAVLSTPFLIVPSKGIYAQPTNTLTMPVLTDEIYPFFAAVSSGWAGKQLVSVRKGDIKQRDEIVFLHGPHFAELLILAVTGFQHEPGVSGREISRK